MLQKLRALVPPVPEQLSIKWRRQDRRHAFCGRVLADGFGGDMSKVQRMALGSLAGHIGVVGQLIAEVRLRPGHSPVTMSAWELLLVELQIASIAWISM